MLDIILFVSYAVLWLVVLFLSFLLLGTLRVIGLLKWRLVQMEATTPSRMNRNGLKPGKMAPDFTLPSVAGADVSLRDFAGRKVLLVFTQSGCGPCHAIMPELVGMQNGEAQIIVVNKGELDDTRKWAAESGARFPVLIQDGLTLSKKYEAFATPFAFLIDEKGGVESGGIVLNKEHLGYVLSGTGKHLEKAHTDETDERTESISDESQRAGSVGDGEVAVADSPSSKEVQHA